MKINKDKKTIEPIIGKAIFNGNLVNYLCDVGAEISITNENFNKLKTNPHNETTPYQGIPLHSCLDEIRVLGTITIKKMVIDPNHYSKHQCILGQDLIEKIPQLKTKLDNMKIILVF